MELREALTQISEIRSQVARTTVFREYRSAPVAFSGCLAFAGAGIQLWWIPRPWEQVTSFLILWFGIALVSVAAAGWELVVRYQAARTSVERETIRLAVEQFLPSIVSGCLITLVLYLFAEDVLWILPGLWSILFSLGIFASCRMLPPAMFWSGAFYLFAGVICLSLGRGEWSLSPWTMAFPFGFGQLLVAGILYCSLEREKGRENESRKESE